MPSIVVRALLCPWLVAAACCASAADRVVVRRDGAQTELLGRVVVTASDGGLLLQTRDGALWSIMPDELVARPPDDTPFQPLSPDQLGSQLLRELPAGFELHVTQHYLVCHNTSRAYAQWCGALFERLYLAFTNYWSRRGFNLREPEFPLVALVFADKPSFAAYAQHELGDATDAIIGYYSLRTNRMTAYDLTGIQALRHPNDRRGSTAQINRMLARPEAERIVATIIHEATHQIAFNCGLQTRYADIPPWISEGIAVYFETPDLTSTTGWQALGSVNRLRLAGFRDYLRRRPADSLKTLLTDDSRMRNSRDAADAYSEVWALCYFLIRQRPQQFHEYFKILAAKPPLVWDDADKRLADFTAAFGPDLRALDEEFLRYLSRVR